jgi:hypothetical protein
MHEKIAIVDEKLVWHGSLNILSHRDTSECMLRVVGAKLAARLIELISAFGGRGKERPRPTEPENPPCPTCGLGTVLKDGRFGVYFECEAGCGGKVDARQRSARKNERSGSKGGQGKASTATGEDRACPQPGCNGRFVLRHGRFGAFLGCTNYPRCKETANL